MQLYKIEYEGVQKNMSKISSLSVLFKWNKVKASCNKTLPRSRCKHACCLHNEYAYIIGGKDGNVSVKDFCRFHIGTHKWEELSYRGEKIPYFEGHSLVAHKRLLLLFGGVLSYDHTESALWIINPDLQYIRRHVPDAGSTQPCARRHHTSVVHNNVMYVYGGYIDLQGSTSDVWAYHIDDEEWEQIKPNQRSENTAGSRHGHTSVLYGREMWVFGGMSGLQAKSDFWRFNLHSLKWDRIKIKYGPPCLSGHSATVVKDYMVIVGGESNGVMSSDIWVFGFCTLKWTHYQPTHQYPSPRKWHSVIPVTAQYRKGDNSVRTKSLPHLQKKGHNNVVNRPKSSPVYSSARFARRSPEQTENAKLNRLNTLALHMTNDSNQNNSTSQPIEMASLSERNADRRSPFKGNGFEKGTIKKDEKSPLLCNRQTSRDSMISNGSGLGTDNPCLELDSSCEKMDRFVKCDNNSSDCLVSLELKDMSENINHKSQIVTRFVKNKKQNFHASNIPGQVNLSPNGETFRCKTHNNKYKSCDLVVEDLEFYDNYFSNSTHEYNRLEPQTHARKVDITHSSNKDLKIKNSDTSFYKTEFNDKTMVHRQNSLEEKSYSMSDISKPNLVQIQPITSKSTSMQLPQKVPCRKCSLNCWMEETEIDDDTLSPVDDNTLSPVDNDTLSPVDVDSQSNATSQIVKQLADDVTESKPTQVQEGCKENVVENGPPYLLLIGGHEERGTNIYVEPIVVWQCDVLVRHSDISHGEYMKSSLVI